MKQITICIGVLLSLFLQACTCNSKKEYPKQIDIIGNWKNPDGASLIFEANGTFIGKSLPAIHFTFYTDKNSVLGKKVSGSGKWELVNGKGFKVVKLLFQRMNDENINGLYPILIAGEKGLLENKPPWYLFVWEEEEGGERYKFSKEQ